MWINDEVDLPEALIAAQTDGRLVVFAGAGVSMGAPSDLPSFDTLAAEIAAGTLVRREGEGFDVFLGRLQEAGTRVHQRAVQILSRASSQPTALHKDLLRIFRTGDAVKLVTTNFDAHFATAAEAVFGHRLTVHRAPALPLGDSIKGIVHLHGAVDGLEATDLVLTDRDFGRAYLTRGWAARFLQDLFATHAVLFVGYSHQDVVIRYLAVGMGATQHGRYALTSEGSDYWRPLGVTAVTYPRVLGDGHESLIRAAASWAHLSEMGSIAHERRVAEVAQRDPPLALDEQDYVLHALKQLSGARSFARTATSEAWVEWLASRGGLNAVFESSNPTTDPEWALVHWFVDRFVLTGSKVAIELLAEHDRPLSRQAWHLIATRLSTASHMSDESFASWIEILVGKLPSELHRLELTSLVEASDRRTDPKALVAVLEAALQPRLRLGPRRYSLVEPTEGRPEVDVQVEGLFHPGPMMDWWKQRDGRHLDELATPLLPIVFAAINKAHRLLRSFGVATDTWDPHSFSRSAIEPHEQDRLERDVDFLVDVARDLMLNRVASSRAWIEAVQAQLHEEAPLARRLIVHVLGLSEWHSADEKVQWILERGLLHSYVEHHEVFQVLKATFPGCSDATVDQLVSALSADLARAEGLDDAEQRRTATYEVYNCVAWLRDAAPDRKPLADWAAMLETTHGFATRDYPDLHAWSSVGWGAPPSEVSTDTFEGRTVLEALSLIQGYADDRPRYAALLGGLSAFVRDNLWWSFEFAAQLHELPGDVWGSLVAGWRGTELTRQEVEVAIAFLEDACDGGARPSDISGFFDSQSKSIDEAMPMSVLETAEAVIDKAIVALGDEEVGTSQQGNLLTSAINSTTGRLTEALLHLLAVRRRKAGDDWSGLPVGYHDRWSSLDVGRSRGMVTLCLLESRIHFVYYVDRAWAAEHLIRKLDWGDERTASTAWHGYLTWGRWNPALLGELIPLYREAFGHLQHELSPVADRMSEHVAGICVYSPGSVEPGWLDAFLRSASQEHISKWGWHVRHMLSTVTSEERGSIWTHWMNAYWERRLTGIPGPLGSEEAAHLIGWTFLLDPEESGAPALAERTPLTLSGHSSLLYEMRESGFLDRHPVHAARLLRRIVRSSEPPYYLCSQTGDAVRALVEGGAEEQVIRETCERLSELGCPEGAELIALLD